MKITIRYRVWTRDNRTTVKEKTFRSEESLRRWTEKNEETNPNWAGVEAYEYTENA